MHIYCVKDELHDQNVVYTTDQIVADAIMRFLREQEGRHSFFVYYNDCVDSFKEFEKLYRKCKEWGTCGL